jgi:dTDP-4-dehydrorhamnose 3,5-epimerase
MDTWRAPIGARERVGGPVIFTETRLVGAYVVDLDRREDHRGWFARGWCEREFAAHGLAAMVSQVNLAWNRKRGTVRGVHFQFPPHAEAKLVRASRGAILDVAVDLRPESPTFLEHVAVELSADNGRALYLPERFGHAYQALEDGTEMSYMASTPYAPGFDGGLSPFDGRLGLGWPLEVTEVSAKDRDARPLGEALEELKRRMAVGAAGNGR